MRALLPPRTWLFVLVSLALGLALPRAADGDDRKKDAKTGIQLVGRSDKDPPPGAWRVFDDAKKRVSEIFNDWGFVPLKPGKYQILIAPRSGSGDVPWGEVTVAAGETATVRVDSGIQLAGRSDKDRPPRAWRIYDGPKNRLTETFNAWGFVPLRPGKYRIMLEPWFSSVDMLWTEVTVEAGKTAAVKLDSGVELVPPARKPSGVHWYFRRAGKKELIARIAGDWGFLLLPPGNYEVETEVRDAVSRFSLSVPPGSVTPLTLKDAGLAELQIELPAAQDVVLATGSSEMKLEATVAPGKKSKERSFQRVSLPDGPATKRLTTWIVHMPKAAARLTSGKLTLECELEALPFEGAKLTFDAAELAARQGLTLFHADFSKAEAGKKQQILVSDGADSSLLRLEQDPPAKRRYLSFGGAGVRLRAGDQEIVRRDLPPGKETAVVFEPTTTMATTAPKIHVDIAIESPAEGTIVKEKKVKLIGRASTTGPAGATRVAIVIDVSGSTTDPSGSADPAINTILKAETAAARLLIDELERIDAKAPGTAFEVALLTFSSDAQILRPLTKMTDPAGVQKLRDALDTLAKTPPKGDTDYPAALREAQKAFRATERRGPSIILFLTDGAPSSGRKNLVPPSLDSAVQLGQQGIVLHAIGLGADFLGKVDAKAAFPPDPRGGANILATMAAAAAPGGTVTPLPRPADVLSVVKRLPILELPEAELKEVQVVNVTTKQPAFKVDLRPDGAFEALVPAALVPWDKHRTNLLEATAIAKDDVSKATDRVTIRGVLPWAKVRILYRGKEGRDTLPLPLLPAVDFILDSSGSMSLPVGDQPKYVIARNVMRDLLSELPRELQVGLRVYGHLGFWRKDGKLLPGAPRNDDPRWCSDSQLVVPIAPVTPKQIAAVKTWVEQVEPFGMTPLVHSLLEARRDFPAGLTAPKMVILISDGKETCGGNLDDVEKAYKDPAIKMVVHVVGFDIEGKDSIAQRNLERLALIGGGRYFKAENAADLAKVLRSAVQATGYVVSSADGKTVVGRGVINGPALELLPGRYQVQLAGGKAAPMTIVLEDNDVRALTLDDAGKLAP